MEPFKLSPTDLSFFNSKLDQITAECSSFAIIQKTSTLKKLLSSYQNEGTISFPTVRPEIEKIVESLKPISLDIAKSMSEKAKSICKGCIFHDDNCLINILFITFKSIEIQRRVEFKDLRPNVRIAF